MGECISRSRSDYFQPYDISYLDKLTWAAFASIHKRERARLKHAGIHSYSWLQTILFFIMGRECDFFKYAILGFGHIHNAMQPSSLISKVFPQYHKEIQFPPSSSPKSLFPWHDKTLTKSNVCYCSYTLQPPLREARAEAPVENPEVAIEVETLEKPCSLGGPSPTFSSLSHTAKLPRDGTAYRVLGSPFSIATKKMSFGWRQLLNRVPFSSCVKVTWRPTLTAMVSPIWPTVSLGDAEVLYWIGRWFAFSAKSNAQLLSPF